MMMMMMMPVINNEKDLEKKKAYKHKTKEC